MRPLAATLATTLLFLVLLDLAVAGALAMAERHGVAGSLVRYFAYGTSVPGKLERWKSRPDVADNLFEVSWLDDMLEESAAGFAREDSGAGPVVRSYGMSFVNDILDAASEARPGLRIDLHAGPGAPPNFTYDRFLADRANRRPGDIVVLGVLSSSVPALTALSNRTWVFEQPAPVTYPRFRPDGDTGLVRVDPLVTSAETERALDDDPVLRAAWREQIKEEDGLYSPFAFALPITDHSPFLRLVRRRLAISAIAERETALLGGDPAAWAELSETLERIMLSFAQTARADGQLPVVVLVQTRGPAPPDLDAAFGGFLEKHGIAHFSTAEVADPSEVGLFLGDGHYRPEVNARFGVALLDLIDGLVQANGSR